MTMPVSPETLASPLPLVALPDRLPNRDAFLKAEATRAQLLQAAAANHIAWFASNAQVSGGEITRKDGLTTIITPGAKGEGILAFPRSAEATDGATLDAFLADCRQKQVRQASCWTLFPKRPRDLGARLVARGFEWGWQPHWMALDFRRMNVAFPLPPGLHIAVDEESEWKVDGLPYYTREDIPRLQALIRARPRRVWHFGAWLNGKLVGHSLLHLTTGRLGVAGLYNVGVVPEARHQGVGRAISLAACQFAQALGCHYALLNAATHIYDRLGFESLGHGQTWWMHAATLTAPTPTPEQIAFAEAVGRGDITTLDALRHRQTLPPDLDAPMPGGTTPMELAVRARKSASARWLSAQGATLAILHAWDLGWKARAPRLLAQNPALANQRFGNWQITPLHEAAMRDDVALARLLLTASPDLTIQDTEFHSTPLGWARFFQRAEIVALIEQHSEG